jgi:hypothetical protein
MVRPESSPRMSQWVATASTMSSPRPPEPLGSWTQLPPWSLTSIHAWSPWCVSMRTVSWPPEADDALCRMALVASSDQNGDVSDRGVTQGLAHERAGQADLVGASRKGLR